jgi:galactokinase/mevalonate kinase-like predicted kinase
MTISILKAFLKYLGIEYTKEILWDLAYQIEREDL